MSDKEKSEEKSQEKGRNNYKNRRLNKKSRAHHDRKSTFNGECEDLKGIIYDINKFSNADDYIKTTEKIANYCARNYQNGGDVRNTISNGVLPTYTIPTRPNPDTDGNFDPTEELILKEGIWIYSKRKDTSN